MKSILVCLALLAIAVSAVEFRTSDGSNNNLKEPSMGAAGEFQTRLLDSNFDVDPLSPNLRVLSNLIAAETNEFANKNLQGINLFEAFFGQFINHDKEWSFTRAGNNESDFYTLPILETTDVLYNASATNNYLRIGRSVLGQGKLDKHGPVEPQLINHQTSWFDLSQLYGNSDADFAAMRDTTGGKLKTSTYTVFAGPVPFVLPNQLPSKAVTGLPIVTALTVADSSILTAGDGRVNENVGLALVTTVFLREHNRIAAALAAAHPTWSNDDLFQNARRLNIAQYQKIITKEYLPVIASAPHLDVFGRYKGYKRNTEGATAVEFSVAAFRYGHSTISNYVMLNSTYCTQFLSIPPGVFGPSGFSTPALPNAGQLGGPFSAPLAFALGGEQNLLRGLLNTKSQKVDTKFTDAVRNIVFIGAQGRGVDLFTFDGVRGRQSGLPSYHDLRREFLELDDEDGEGNVYDECQGNPRRENEPDPIECFLLITSDLTLATKLKSFYGKVTKIDGLAGLLAEDHLPGSFLPRTLANIVMSEYKRSRDADRFWYEKDGILSNQEAAAVQARTFKQILADAYPGLEVQDDIFHVPAVPNVCH